MNDKIKVALTAVIAVLVILTFLLWTAAIPIAVLVLVIAVIYLKRSYGSIKKGLPVEDERSKKVMTKALANAYLISLFWLLAISWASYNIIEFQDVSQAIGKGIIGMAVIFGICYFYFNMRGDLE